MKLLNIGVLVNDTGELIWLVAPEGSATPGSGPGGAGGSGGGTEGAEGG